MTQCIRFPVLSVGLVVALIAGCTAPDRPAIPEDYEAGEEAWRTQRQERLRSPTGWLTLVGLHWLQPGDNRFGSGPDCEVRFPDWAAPEDAGVLTLADGQVRVAATAGIEMRVNDQPIDAAVLAPEDAGKPDVVTIGELSFHVIERSGRLAIRSRHPDHPALAAFEGTEWYPIDPAYRAVGRLDRYDPALSVEIPTVLGTAEPMVAPGIVRFELLGRDVSLQPVVSKPNDTELFFIFKDSTSGHGTYRPGRFLYGDLQPDGTVVVDFNRAYNPPCAFTPYATCPLPPRDNWLDVAIEAGEKDSGEH